MGFPNDRCQERKDLTTKIGKDESTKEEKTNHFFFACPVGDPVVDPEVLEGSGVEGSRVEGCFRDILSCLSGWGIREFRNWGIGELRNLGIDDWRLRIVDWGGVRA